MANLHKLLYDHIFSMNKVLEIYIYVCACMCVIKYQYWIFWYDENFTFGSREKIKLENRYIVYYKIALHSVLLAGINKSIN